jgi:hypothetical protein
MPKTIQAGTQEAWFMFYDSNGDPSGDTPDALANATSAGAYKLVGIQEAPSAVPESKAVTIPGDDGSLGAIEFASDAPREIVLNFGQMDLTLEARLQNTDVDTFGSIEMGLIDLANIVLGTGALIIQGKAVNRDQGSEGLAAWSGIIYPYVQLLPLNRETWAGRTAGVVRYKAVAQQAYNNPWGTTIVNKAGTPIGAYARPFKSAHPLTMDAFRGALSSFTLNRSPVAVSTTRPFSDKVAIGVTSINTPTPKLLTLSGSVSAGRPGLVFYEYQ